MAVRRLDLRAHPPQRLGDALHRPGRERLVARQRERAVLEGEQPDDQPRERAGVAAVDRGDCSPRRPSAVHDELVAVVVDLGAERAHRGERRLGVARAAEAAHDGLAVGDGAEQQRPVRDRLVAGHGEVPVERDGRLDLHHR